MSSTKLIENRTATTIPVDYAGGRHLIEAKAVVEVPSDLADHAQQIYAPGIQIVNRVGATATKVLPGVLLPRTQDARLFCPTCAFAADNQRNLDTHIGSSHPKTDPVVLPPAGGILVTCPRCAFTAHNQHEVVEHLANEHPRRDVAPSVDPGIVIHPPLPAPVPLEPKPPETLNPPPPKADEFDGTVPRHREHAPTLAEDRKAAKIAAKADEKEDDDEYDKRGAKLTTKQRNERKR